MSEFTQNQFETIQLTDSLFKNQPYRGVPYSNLQLYGDNISEVVDRECAIQPYSVSTYWPGGLPSLVESNFGTFLLNEKTNHQAYSRVTEIRKTILSIDLSKRALRRWQDATAGQYDHLATELVPTDDSYVSLACEVSQVPFSTVVLSEVLRHRAIKAGQTVAHLYFPSMMKNPKLALEALKIAQIETINSEKI